MFSQLSISCYRNHIFPGWQNGTVCSNYKTNMKYYCILNFRVHLIPSFHTNTWRSSECDHSGHRTFSPWWQKPPEIALIDRKPMQPGHVFLAENLQVNLTTSPFINLFSGWLLPFLITTISAKKCGISLWAVFSVVASCSTAHCSRLMQDYFSSNATWWLIRVCP